MRYGIDGRYIQDHFPGIGRYTYYLALHLADLAPDDTFIVFYHPGADNARYDLARLQVKHNLALVRAPASPFSWRQQFMLPRLARHYRLDLYHSPYYIMPYLMPCPSVATIHDLIPSLYPESLPHPRLSWVFSSATRLTLSRAARVLVDAESTRADLRRVMGVREDRVEAVPLAVDDSFHPYPQAEAAHVRRHWGLDKPYLLYLGINKPHKNLVRLVQAWAALPPALRAEHTLALAGREDPRYPEVHAEIARLGLSDQVRVLGDVSTDQVPPLYAGALGFVFPSLYEGFGLPVLEAMACGTPVACSRRSSLPEIVGEAGLLFDPEDALAIRDALVRLLVEPALRERLSRAGLERARGYTWQRTAAATLAVYRRVLRER